MEGFDDVLDIADDIASPSFTVCKKTPSGAQYLFSRDRFARHNLASISKVALAMVVCDAVQEGFLSFDDTVQLQRSDLPHPKFFKLWDFVSVQDLFNAALVSSSGTACLALARRVSETRFGDIKPEVALTKALELMNEKAQRLGLNDTRFGSVHGSLMDDSKQYSTCSDLTEIILEVVRNYPDVKAAMMRRRVKVDIFNRKHGGSRSISFSHTSKIVKRLQVGLTGGKTGTLRTNSQIEFMEHDMATYVFCSLGSPARTNHRFKDINFAINKILDTPEATESMGS